MQCCNLQLQCFATCCDKIGTLPCKHCKLVFYCCEKHVQKDWKEHHAVQCKPVFQGKLGPSLLSLLRVPKLIPVEKHLRIAWHTLDKQQQQSPMWHCQLFNSKIRTSELLITLVKFRPFWCMHFWGMPIWCLIMTLEEEEWSQIFKQLCLFDCAAATDALYRFICYLDSFHVVRRHQQFRIEQCLSYLFQQGAHYGNYTCVYEMRFLANGECRQVSGQRQKILVESLLLPTVLNCIVAAYDTLESYE